MVWSTKRVQSFTPLAVRKAIVDGSMCLSSTADTPRRSGRESARTSLFGSINRRTGSCQIAENRPSVSSKMPRIWKLSR